MKKGILYSFVLAVTFTVYACNDAGNGSETPSTTDTSNTSADSMSRNNDYQQADTTADSTK